MQTFRILYFRQNVLASTEEVEVQDVLEAIEKASAKSPEYTAEIWGDNGKMGMVPPSPEETIA